MAQITKQVVKRSLFKAIWIDAILTVILFVIFILPLLTLQEMPPNNLKMKMAKTISPSEFSQAQSSDKYSDIYVNPNSGIKCGKLIDTGEWQKTQDNTIKKPIFTSEMIIFMIIQIIILYVILYIPSLFISLGIAWYKALPDK
jgi:hypothetical protein